MAARVGGISRMSVVLYSPVVEWLCVAILPLTPIYT
jgi:hypothetical protein